MSEPEIARRCHACGASIRDRALFCPQCGKELKTTGELTKSGTDQDALSTAVATAPLNEVPKQNEQLDAGRSAEGTGVRPKPEDPKTKEAASSNLAGWAKGTPDQPGRATGTPEPMVRAKGTPGAHALAEARGKVQRATGMARNVGGEMVQRGQKLREMSSVVLDEASYDPSLRFVLVAAALFILFLLIVVLNRFIV